MNINSLVQENVEYKSYKLPVSLYPLKMRESEDGKVKFHARTMFRNKLLMEDIANDLIATGIIKDENSQQIVKLWNKLNGAIIDRVLNGSIVDCGIGILYAKLSGSFETRKSDFDSTIHQVDIGFRTNKETKDIVASVRPVISQSIGITPELIEALDVESQRTDLLTPGGQLVIKGKNLMVTGTNDDIGLYFVNQDTKAESCIKESKMARNTGSEIICTVPALEAGTYKLMIKTQKSKKFPSKDTVSETFKQLYTVA